MSTETQINSMASDLQTLAQNIHDDLTALAAAERFVEEIETDLEAMKAAIVSNVANARFEINGKLRYTNDDQRRSAVIETQTADPNFQSTVAARRNLIQTAAGKRALIEHQRKQFRARELLLLYHANNPI